MTDSEPSGKQPPQGDTALLTAALNYAWTSYDTWTNRIYQLTNYLLVASAILATAYASAINGKHYGLAAFVSAIGLALVLIAFPIGVSQRLIANSAIPTLVTLQSEIARRLGDIDPICIMKAPRRRGIMVGLPPLVLTLAVGIAALVYALNQ